MTRRCSGKALAVVFWVSIGTVGLGIIAALAPDSVSTSGRVPRLTVEEREWTRRFEAMIEEHIAQGMLHSVDVTTHRVRIAPLIWSLQTLETKQTMVKSYSVYFQRKDGFGYVDILSDRNDQKLASYSVGKGIQIHQ